MNRRAVIVIVVSVLVVAVATVVALQGGSDSPSSDAPAVKLHVGDTAPDFTLPSIADEKVNVSLRQFRGSPTVLTFGASWCHPCRVEYPRLMAAKQQHGDLKVLGVLERDSPGLMVDFMKEVGADWPVANDADLEVATKYGVDGLPDTYFLDAEGTITGHVIGEMSAKTLDAQLATLLAPLP